MTSDKVEDDEDIVTHLQAGDLVVPTRDCVRRFWRHLVWCGYSEGSTLTVCLNTGQNIQVVGQVETVVPVYFRRSLLSFVKRPTSEQAKQDQLAKAKAEQWRLHLENDRAAAAMMARRDADRKAAYDRDRKAELEKIKNDLDRPVFPQRRYALLSADLWGNPWNRG